MVTTSWLTQRMDLDWDSGCSSSSAGHSMEELPVGEECTPCGSPSPGSKVCSEYGAYLVRPELPTPAVTFANGDEYRSFFRNLINWEAWNEKTMKESGRNKIYPISVRWSKKFTNTCIANFGLPMDQKNSLRVAPGVKLKLKYDGDRDHLPWQSMGRVMKFTDDGKVALELESSKGVPTDLKHYFSVEFIWTGYCFDIMLAAIDKLSLSEPYVSRNIYDRLFGKEVEAPPVDRLLPHGSGVHQLTHRQPKFDSSHCQVSTIEAALQQPLSLICGFPGTGKISISVAVAHHLSRQSSGQVLVCAHRNTTVDDLARKISVTSLKVVRLCARYLENLNSPMNNLTLHYQAREKLKTRHGSAFITSCYSKENEGTFTQCDERTFQAMKRAAEWDVLKSADVICCTCFGAGDSRLNGMTFSEVVIDHDEEASEPESIIPLVLGCKQAVLIGHPNQLAPMVKCKETARTGLQLSLFERLRLLGEKPHPLRV